MDLQRLGKDMRNFENLCLIVIIIYNVVSVFRHSVDRKNLSTVFGLLASV